MQQQQQTATQESDPLVLYSVTNRVATIRLNRPLRLNALNRPLSQAFVASINKASASNEVSCHPSISTIIAHHHKQPKRNEKKFRVSMFFVRELFRVNRLISFDFEQLGWRDNHHWKWKRILFWC